jgi:hypothetical protein
MNDDTEEDYEFSRKNYYDLVEKGSEAIDLMLELARESEHPRAFEVLSNMIKNTAEVSDKLMTLQKHKREIEKQTSSAQPNKLTQNNIFVGSSTDLQRMLISRDENKGHIIDAESEE